MGSASWHDDIVQALLIGFVVQIVAYALCVFCAFLWNSCNWKEWTARPATGESMAESDVEMGTVNAPGSAPIPDNPVHGLAANSGVGDDGNLEYTGDTTNTRTRASTPEIPTADHRPKVQCKNVTEDVKRRASVPVLVHVSHPYQVEVMAGSEAKFSNPPCSILV